MLLEDLIDYLNDGEDVQDYFTNAFSWVYGVAVDWREEEEAIASYFNDILDETDSLSAEYEPDAGKLVVDYNGTIYDIKLTESQADRYIAIRSLQEIISDKYALKLFEDSYLSDTHVFLILHKDM